MPSSKKLPERWRKENQATRAVQVAFDLGERVQKAIRQEALDHGINPSDRIREILGLEVNAKPKRLRLSISLADADFEALAETFGLDPTDRISIKQMAAEQLVAHVNQTKTKHE